MEFNKVIVLLVLGCWFNSGVTIADERQLSLKTIAQITAQETNDRLMKNQGFLLLKLNVNHDAASLNFAKIKQSNKQYIFETSSLKLGKNHLLNLHNVNNEFFLLPLEQGNYQITRVSAPFYNLPYWRPTQELTNWRFVITPGKINYVGEISISAERGTDFMNVNLFNRFATDQQQLKSTLSALLNQYPLTSGSGYRDDFFTEWKLK